MQTPILFRLTALFITVAGVLTSSHGGEAPPPPTLIDAVVGLRDAVSGLPEEILHGDRSAQRSQARAERKLARAVEIAMSDVHASEVKAYSRAASAVANLIKSGLNTLFDEEVEAFVAAARASARSSVASVAEKVDVYDDALGFLGRRVARIQTLEHKLDEFLLADDLLRFLKRTTAVLRKSTKLTRQAEKIIDRIMAAI